MMFLKARRALLSAAIVNAVPLLNLVQPASRWPHPLNRLRMLPSRSLGRELARFLAERGTALLPKYERHDALHVLLGYDTDVTGELRLQGFMLGNACSTRAGMGLFALGVVMMPELWLQLACDVARGARMPAMEHVVLSQRLARPLDRVRAQLRVDMDDASPVMRRAQVV